MNFEISLNSKNRSSLFSLRNLDGTFVHPFEDYFSSKKSTRIFWITFWMLLHWLHLWGHGSSDVMFKNTVVLALHSLIYLARPCTALGLSVSRLA